MGFIFTIEDKCRGCYACVRSCPAKAIKVKEGIAGVMDERCVACGYCINICAVEAKQARSDIDTVWGLLGQPSPVIAILSSALPAAFPGIRPRQIVSALRKLGFSEVMETAFGAGAPPWLLANVWVGISSSRRRSFSRARAHDAAPGPTQSLCSL